MLLVDTNVISELRRLGKGKGHASVAQWVDTVDAGDFHMSVITLHELETGVRSKELRDPVQGQALRTWLETQIIPGFAGRIIRIDQAVALRAAQLQVPDRRPISDAFIAATALVHGMTVVTRNIADFRNTGVAVINPWASANEE